MSTIGTEILEGLREFNDALASGSSVSDKLTVRKLKLTLKPKKYDPELVRITRMCLGVSQAVFAEFLGVSVKTVRAWEQGNNPVNGAAARLMDEIRDSPEHFRARLLKLAENVEP